MAACVQQKKTETEADYKGEKKELTFCVVCHSRILTVKYLYLRISDIRRGILDIRHRTSDIGHGTLDMGRWTLDVGHLTSDIRHRKSDIRHQ